MPKPISETEARSACPAPSRHASLPPEAQGALLESRQRWRDLATLAADLAFETDAAGQVTFVMPETVLGWPGQALLGRPACWLLLQPEPDPFALRQAVRDLRVWLRRADGEAACLSFAAAPLAAPDGGFGGLRGVARDMTAEVRDAGSQAATLRRALAVQALVRRIREAALAPRMLPALLRHLPAAIGCAGAAVVEPGPEGRLRVTHCEGGNPAGMLGRLPVPDGAGPLFLEGTGGEVLALITPPAAMARHQALLVWREPGARAFDEDERHLLMAASDLTAVVLGNHNLMHELERQARTEALTGLLNRRSFLDELGRRLRHLQQTRQGGVLLFLDLDNLKPINDGFGHTAGDAALVALARLLAASIRPCDLAARCGGDEFAVWMDGAGEAAGTARAATICRNLAGLPQPAEASPRLSVSIGCAVVAPGEAETPEALLARADAAMYEAKRAGGGGWRLAAPAATPGAQEP